MATIDPAAVRRINAFCKDRDEALIDVVENDKLDKYKAFIKKWFGYKHIPFDDIVLKVSVYKAVVSCREIPQEVKDKAKHKCIALGFKPCIDWSDVQ